MHRTFCLLVFLTTCAIRAETVTLPATANAGISSFRPGTVNKEGQWSLSWCGREGKQTLAIRQNQNWSGFENRDILLKFDMTAVKGWTVSQATLHLAMAEGELFGVGACSILNDWKEGTQDGKAEPGAPSWNYRANPKEGEKPTDRNLWAWPGSQFYSVSWLHPALRYSHAGPSQIERYTDADGVKWIKFPIDPDLVHAMAVGASYGMVLTDDKGQVAEAYMLEKNPKPYVYDASFEMQVYSRHAKDGKLAPKLEITGEKNDTTPPGKITLPEKVSGRYLEFFAPGDDGDKGTALTYRGFCMPYDAEAPNPLTLPLFNLPKPLPPGGSQRLDLSFLQTGRYAVQIRAVDEAGNQGPASSTIIDIPQSQDAKLPQQPEVTLDSDLGSFGTVKLQAFNDVSLIDPISGPKKDAIGVWNAKGSFVSVAAAQNEVVAFQLAFSRKDDASINDIEISASDLKGEGASIPAANVELFREWYVKSVDAWHADALLPLNAPFETKFSIPAKDNVGDSQNFQTVWADVYVPRGTPPGAYIGELTLKSPALKEPAVIKLNISVRNFALPDENTFPVELNTYGGIGSFAGIDINKEPERFLAAERSYYCLAHKHRCTLNILRYSHSGRISEHAVPPLEGDGAERKISNFTDFDARFGQYFDGSAFSEKNGYRGPGADTPVSHFYLPLHENWPMELDKYYKDTAQFPDRKTFAEWAKKSERLDQTVAPEFCAGFKNVVSQTAKHLEEKQWTRTAFQFFLNNKYYYKCPFFIDQANGMTGGSNGKCYWLLDEPIDFDDMDANRFLLSLCQQGVKDAGPNHLKLHYRVDVSNPHMVRGLWDGVVNLWCCSFLHEVAATARVRQKWMPDEQWANYGGGIGVGAEPTQQVGNFLTRYSWGCVYVLPYWTNFGERDWKKSSDTSIYYTGFHYAGTDKIFDGALPGVRMKILRRAQQDMEYLNLLAKAKGWERDAVIEALRPWADDPQAVDGLKFTKLTPEKLTTLRESVARTVQTLK